TDADYDGFLARLDESGVPIWARQIASPNAAFVRHVVVADDWVLATGYAGRFPEGSGREPISLDLGGGPITGNGGFDAFFAVYDRADGSYRSGRVIGGAGDEQAIQVVSLPGGEAAILGQFTETFEGRTARERDLFVLRLRADGSMRWIATAGGPADDEPGGLAALPDGDLVVTGTFSHAFSIGDVELTGGRSAGFFARLSGDDGTVRWARGVGETDWSKGAFIASESTDEVVVAAEFAETIRIGDASVAAQGQYDALILALDPGTGESRWFCRVGGSDDEHPLGLAQSKDSLVVVGAAERPDRTADSVTAGDRRRGMALAVSPRTCTSKWTWSTAGDDDWVRRVVALETGTVALAGWHSRVGGTVAAGGRDIFVAVGRPPPGMTPAGRARGRSGWVPVIVLTAGAALLGWSAAAFAKRRRFR
ncbi:MAG TPA: hypothetical protein VM841_00045, partial [Actinomycetota bacterium]|nr:hypothetical protein [Actinomycetota bacterium]